MAEERAGRRQQELVTDRLRDFGVVYREYSRRFAEWLGLHSTDAEALIEILNAEERGAPLSPARLSDRIGLSHPATTALLNRLEQAGHVTRTREQRDRRVVTVRADPRIQTLADEFFTPLGIRVGRVMDGYPSEQLQGMENLLNDLLAVMRIQLDKPITPLDAHAPRGTT
ncbi:hypothetical protein GCM10009551_064630 [Nocardiopsis tropica]|uniref:MarR family winged helix-turn-helix transcriptional regulator n=1 Tax=Tsukamurella strandjordii TaxID=147577 RepID=UPI0031DB4FA0